MTEATQTKSRDARTVKGKVLRRYFQKHGYDFVARYRIDENAEYNVCWIEDTASYETKKEFLQTNGFSKSRSITTAPEIAEASDVNFAKQIFYSPLGEETLEKPVYEQKITSIEKFKTRKQKTGTGQRGRKSVTVESFEKWVEKVKAHNVQKDQANLGMKKLHIRYSNWCVKNSMEPVNYDKFWVVMKKAGLHQVLRQKKVATTQAVEAV